MIRLRASVPPVMSPRCARSISAGMSWGTNVFTSVWIGTNESTYNPEMHRIAAMPIIIKGCLIVNLDVFSSKRSSLSGCLLVFLAAGVAISEALDEVIFLDLNPASKFFLLNVSRPYIRATPTKRDERKHIIIPMRSSFAKSCIMGTVDVKSEKNPRPVMISAVSTAGPVCLIVCITAFASSCSRLSSSSIRLWNCIA